jgi:hypothetical protein
MYWPLGIGFILIILLALFLGWVTGPSRSGDTDGHGH